MNNKTSSSSSANNHNYLKQKNNINTMNQFLNVGLQINKIGMCIILMIVLLLFIYILFIVYIYIYIYIFIYVYVYINVCVHLIDRSSYLFQVEMVYQGVNYYVVNMKLEKYSLHQSQ